MLHKVVTISQQKGGAGKTTIAAHLAVALAQKNLKVAVLDVDPQQSLTCWHEVRVETLGADGAALTLSTATDWWRLRAEIDRLREEHDVVVVDCPPHAKNDAKTAIRQADLVIIPLQPSPADLWASTPTLELTLQENKNTFLLLNRMVPNTQLGRQFLIDLPSNRIISVIGNRIGFAASMAEGLTIQETEPSGKGAKEIAALADAVERIVIDAEQREISAAGEELAEEARHTEEESALA